MVQIDVIDSMKNHKKIILLFYYDTFRKIKLDYHRLELRPVGPEIVQTNFYYRNNLQHSCLHSQSDKKRNAASPKSRISTAMNNALM